MTRPAYDGEPMPKNADTKMASFASLLHEHGFKGSAPTFRRFRGDDFVEVVNLQASSGEYYVNLGAHHRWLGKPKSWAQIKEYECAFRARLVDFAASDRFALDDEASVTALLEMMKLTGMSFFAQLGPDRIAATTKQLARVGYRKFVPLDAPAAATTWIKVAAHLGDEASKKRFEAQDAAETAARQAEDEAEAAEAVEITYAEFRAAKKAGRPLPKVLRIVFDTGPKARAAKTRAGASPKKMAAKKKASAKKA